MLPDGTNVHAKQPSCSFASNSCNTVGTVQSIELTTANGEKRTVPNGEGRVHRVPEELVVNLLGRTFTDDELEHAINRMGGRFDGRKPASKDAPMKTKKWRKQAPARKNCCSRCRVGV